MGEVSKMYATNEAFREVADLLFGSGQEIVAKANPDGADLARKKRQRREAQVGYASNIVGIAAGAAGTAEAAKKFREVRGRGPKHRGTGAVMGKLKRVSPKIAVPATVGAGAALGLQAANLGGDAVANRVLARSAKKDDKVKKYLKPVSKSVKEIPENASFPNKRQLTAASITSAARAGGKGAELVRSGKLKKLPEKVKTSRVRKAQEIEVKWEGEISKVNADKQQVFGWASIVEVNGEPVVDLQGDYISIDEVEKSAYEYVCKSRKGGDMHLRDEWNEPKHASDMIESFVVTDEKKKALGLPDSTPTGWWVGYQVNDPDVWQKVKSGERTGFSIHGKGMRSPM